MGQDTLDLDGKRDDKPLLRPTPHQLPDDLMELFADVPSAQLAGRSERELRDMLASPLVAAAIRIFKCTITGIEGKVGSLPPGKSQPTPSKDEPPHVEQIQLF